MNANTLALDLRENTSVKSEASAFLDLRRSCFLHQLRFLNIPFCVLQPNTQQSADWKEIWELKWSSEAEITLIENSLYGESCRLMRLSFPSNKSWQMPPI